MDSLNCLDRFRIDTSDDNKVSKEEFCSDKVKEAVDKWIEPVDDMEAGKRLTVATAWRT